MQLARRKGIVLAGAALLVLGVGVFVSAVVAGPRSVGRAEEVVSRSGPPQPQSVAAYLPADAEVTAILQASYASGYRATSVPAEPSTWEAAARYMVRFGDSTTSTDHGYELILSAARFPTTDEAAAALATTAERLLAEHAPSREYPLATPDAASGHAAREVRYNFVDTASGEERGSYTRVLQVGCVVAVVDARGRPNPDFVAPVVDNDRALIAAPAGCSA